MLFRKRMLNQIEVALLFAVIVLSFANFITIFQPSEFTKAQQATDFAAYYLAARTLNADKPLYDPATVAEVAAQSGGIYYTTYLYPPFFAALLRPLALLPYNVARIIWLLLNLLFLVLSLILLFKITPIPRPFIGLVLYLLILMPPIYYTLWLGQVNLLILLLILGSIWFLILPNRQSQVIAGVLLGLATGLKILPGLLGLSLLLRRRFLALLAMSTTILGLFAFGISAGGGLTNTKHWFSKGLTAAIDKTVTNSANQSVYAAMERLLVGFPSLATLLGYLCAATIASLTLYQLIKKSNLSSQEVFGWDFALILTTTTLIAPLVWYHYYAWLVIPMLTLLHKYHQVVAVRLILLSSYLFLLLDRRKMPLPELLHFLLAPSYGFYSNLLLWLLLLYLFSDKGWSDQRT